MTKENHYESKDVKYEHCVKDVKGQKRVNPYAVCHSSVYGKSKKKSEYVAIPTNSIDGEKSEVFITKESAERFARKKEKENRENYIVAKVEK